MAGQGSGEPGGGNDVSGSKSAAFNLRCRRDRLLRRCVAGRRPDSCRRDHRPGARSGRGCRSRRDHHRHGDPDESAASGGVHARRCLHRPEPGARRIPARCRARRFQTPAPRRHSPFDGGESADRFRSQRGGHSRTGHGRGPRLANCASGDRKPRDRGRERAGREVAAQRPPVHHARRDRAWRRPAAELRPAAHQRRQTANERVSLRRHLRAAARARAACVLSDHRRHPGVQDREQQPGGRVRAVQWRRGQSHDEIRHEHL